MNNSDLLYLGLGGAVLGFVISRLFNITTSVGDGDMYNISITDVNNYLKDNAVRNKTVMTPIEKVFVSSVGEDKFGYSYIQNVGLMDYDKNTVARDFYVKINSPVIYSE